MSMLTPGKANSECDSQSRLRSGHQQRGAVRGVMAMTSPLQRCAYRKVSAWRAVPGAASVPEPADVTASSAARSRMERMPEPDLAVPASTPSPSSVVNAQLSASMAQAYAQALGMGVADGVADGFAHDAMQVQGAFVSSCGSRRWPGSSQTGRCRRQPDAGASLRISASTSPKVPGVPRER